MSNGNPTLFVLVFLQYNYVTCPYIKIMCTVEKYVLFQYNKKKVRIYIN